MRSGCVKAPTILARVLAAAPRQLLLDRLVPLLAGLMVLAAAAGSSSVPRLTRIGHGARWGVLVALLLAAAAWSLPRVRVPRRATLAAAALVGLAILSAAWSVEPRTSFERGASLGLLFATCSFVAAAVRRRTERAAAVLVGLLGGATAVGVAGLLLLAFDRTRAVQAATYEAPARYQGLGQNPNTVGLLFALATPIATWALLAARTRRRRATAGCVLGLFVGTIVASGSRGAIVAGAVGAAIVLASSHRRRTIALAALVSTVVAAAAIQTIPSPATTAVSTAVSPAAAPPAARKGYVDAESVYPLDADVGQPLPGGGQPLIRRGLFAASGRLDAWGGTLHEVARRPIVGHGFGTEQDVFIDRYYRFVGGLPEDSYLGLALQLGIVGVVALAALVGVLAVAGVRALQATRRDVAAAGLGILVSGLAIAVVQSYVYSVGNIATTTLWLGAFLLPAIGEGSDV